MRELILFPLLMIAVLSVVLICLGISAVVTMFAWNIIIPAVFGLSKISFLQALGLNLLVGLLTNNIRIRNER